MPAKSKRAKAKRYKQPQSGTSLPVRNTMATSQAGSTTPAVPAPIPATRAIKSPTATAAAAASANQHSFVPGDLRRIGILTGIIIIVLIALYFILT